MIFQIIVSHFNVTSLYHVSLFLRNHFIFFALLHCLIKETKTVLIYPFSQNSLSVSHSYYKTMSNLLPAKPLLKRVENILPKKKTVSGEQFSPVSLEWKVLAMYYFREELHQNCDGELQRNLP